MDTTASSFTLRKNAERAARAMIRKGTAPAVDYGIKSSDDGFEIVWKIAKTVTTTDEVETEIAEASAEQPAAASLAEAGELSKLAATHKRIAQVGHLERFNPAVRATIPLLTQPMFFEVHRLSVFTPRSLDVDVVLDLMIHDLDIVLSFANSPVKEVRAVGLPILSGKVDIANVRLEFESGCVANFTASRVSTERVRKLRFFQPQQYVSVDYGRQEVLVFTVGAEGSASGAPTVNPQIKVAKPPVTSEEPLHAELRSFLQAVRQRSTPVVPLEDGRRSLALALEIVGAIREHGKKVGLAGLAKAKG